MTVAERLALSRSSKALRSVQQSFKLLFDPASFPMPQDSIGMGCVKGVFFGVPDQVNDALKAIKDCRAASKRGGK